MNGLTVTELTKKYGQQTALDSVSLTFEPNRIYGLLGRNGAGKSTLLNTISGRIFPTSGTVTLDGMNLAENDAALSRLYLESGDMLYPESMKVRDVFRATKQFYSDFDMTYANSTANHFGLSLFKRVKGLSTGYASILKLIVALSVNTPYVMFDEPVLGLDANHRDLFYRLLLEKYAAQPFCIVMSTHLIEEVAPLVEQVIIIHGGHIVRDDSTENLLRQGYTISGTAGAVNTYAAEHNCIGIDTLGGLASAYILGTPDTTMPSGLEISPINLQKLFIQLTNS